MANEIFGAVGALPTLAVQVPSLVRSPIGIEDLAESATQAAHALIFRSPITTAPRCATPLSTVDGS